VSLPFLYNQPAGPQGGHLGGDDIAPDLGDGGIQLSPGLKLHQTVSQLHLPHPLGADVQQLLVLLGGVAHANLKNRLG
jgi:hypothetical protein